MSRPYYFVQEGRGGVWHVCHRIAGTDQGHIDCECLSHRAAANEAARLERERNRALSELYADQLLRDRRAFA